MAFFLIDLNFGFFLIVIFAWSMFFRSLMPFYHTLANSPHLCAFAILYKVFFMVDLTLKVFSKPSR